MKFGIFTQIRAELLGTISWFLSYQIRNNEDNSNNLKLRKLNNQSPSQNKEEKKNHLKFTEHAFAATLPHII